MSKIVSKPTKMKLINTARYSADRQDEIERFNFMRKVVNLKGGVEKALRAYNKQAKKPISQQTFARYLSPGSSSKQLSTFLASKY